MPRLDVKTISNTIHVYQRLTIDIFTSHFQTTFLSL